MGEWGYVTFVRHADVDAVEAALGRLFAAEGMKRTEARPRARDQHQLQYGSGRTSKYWAVALGAGAPGWTVLRGAPAELLGEPREDGGVPRLAALAREIGADAAHVSLYDGTAAVIVEASPDGTWGLSGYTMEGGLAFHGIPIPEERAEPRFERTPLPAQVGRAFSSSLVDGYYGLLDTLAGDRNWDLMGGALIANERPPVSGVRLLRFERRDPGPRAAPPLRVGYAKAAGGRITLAAGGGAMWIDGWYAHAPDA